MTSSICDHVSFFAVMLLCRASSRWLLSCLPKLLRSANSFCTLSTAAAFFFSSSAALPAEVNLPPPPFPLPIPRPLPRVRLLDWAAVFSVSCPLEYLTALDLHLHRHLFFFSFSFAVFDLLFFFFVLRFFLYFFVLFFLSLSDSSPSAISSAFGTSADKSSNLRSSGKSSLGSRRRQWQLREDIFRGKNHFISTCQGLSHCFEPS